MDERDLEIQRMRGRLNELADMVCQLCRAADPDTCKRCRVEKIRKEAAHDSSMQRMQ